MREVFTQKNPASGEGLTPEELDAKVGEMLEKGTLIGSLWTYPATTPMGETPLLISPLDFGLDSGWITLKIAQFARTGMKDFDYQAGSRDFTDGNGDEIRFAIFRTMARDGMVGLVQEGPGTEVEPGND